MMSRFSPKAMPLPLVEKIVGHVGWPMKRLEAEAHREGLMRERKVFVDKHTEQVFEREFSLCEH